MKSVVLPSFWSEYRQLNSEIRQSARKAYWLWAENPFHPSLHFKCINTQEDIWSVRVTRGYRALGVLEEDTVTWFWIGSHDNYERFFG
ncbi:ParE family toxin-like protein [Nostoc sp.]|uniref:ParE family toxin-like protein n=1 Tax=Nostoc sp. TaxID=1180 RepID=UPI003FA55D43